MTQRDGRHGGPRIVAFASMLLISALALAIGTLLARLLVRLWPALEVYAISFLLLSISTFVFFLCLLLLSGPALARLLNCGSDHIVEALPGILASMAMLAISTLGAVIFSNAAHADWKSLPNSQSSIGVVFAQGRASHDSILLPFFPVEGKSGNCDWHSQKFGDAARMSGVGVEMALKDLIKSLSACGSDSNPVTIDIRGFASSSEFKGCEGSMPRPNQDVSISEFMNWRLAERRRQAVIDSIKDTSNRINISPDAGHDRWASSHAMREEMQFSDREMNGSYSTEKGALTRRAEIVIISKGSCQPR